MLLLPRTRFLNKVLTHHKAIHDLGITLIALVTATILYLEVRNTRVNSESALITAKAQKEIVELSIKKRQEEFSTSVIERLAKAVELLSSTNPSTRLAGIYSLERLANDLPDESVAIARIITTFITNPSKGVKKDEVRRGFLTLLRIVKKIGPDPFISQESNLNLAGLKLEGFHLKDYSFRGFLLSGAKFYNVGFTNIDFAGVNLKGATFKDCYKGGVLNFTSANLSGSNIITTNFSEAVFVDSKLNRASIEGGSFENADFSNANMENLILRDTKLSGSIDPPNIKHAIANIE